MNLFEVQAHSDRSEVYSQRQWLIMADSLYEAMWLVPEQWTVDAVEIRRAAAPGPGRVIGWMTGTTSSGKAGGPQPARPGAADRRKPPAADRPQPEGACGGNISPHSLPDLARLRGGIPVRDSRA